MHRDRGVLPSMVVRVASTLVELRRWRGRVEMRPRGLPATRRVARRAWLGTTDGVEQEECEGPISIVGKRDALTDGVGTDLLTR